MFYAFSYTERKIINDTESNYLYLKHLDEIYYMKFNYHISIISRVFVTDLAPPISWGREFVNKSNFTAGQYGNVLRKCGHIFPYFGDISAFVVWFFLFS